jgi:acyl-CoA reductase-like NAD-dependent aldehyde dehydrogenase/nicotinamidase-related amidase
MTRALLLVDLQNDFLAAPGLEPPSGVLVERAAELLRGCRERSIPVVHVWTTVTREGDDRMPHWRRAGRWQCVAGTEGHQPPEPLRPDAEPVVEKTFYSGFSNPQLEQLLARIGADELILCGVHLHGCVRATALDAYQRGLGVWVATDAVGSYDGVHAAVTLRYLEDRVARFAAVDSLLAEPGGDEKPRGGPVSAGGRAADAAVSGRRLEAQPLARRLELLEAAADAIERSATELTQLVVDEVGKPWRYAAAEVDRGASLLLAAARAPEPIRGVREAGVRRRPLGTVAQITPFNNPVAVPLGKLAAALRWGNSVVWKPSPAATRVAQRVVGLLTEAGWPSDLVSLLPGGAEAARELMADPAIDAVSLTGSSAAGFAAQAICAERRIPLQAELGGNNASIVWRDGELGDAARMIAEAGLGAAGQRCTANRRVVVDEACHREFVEELESAAAALRIGDPTDPEVQIGPLVSPRARERVAAAVERAARRFEVREPVRDPGAMRRLAEAGPYHPPALVLCDRPGDEIVQEETFGPVVVVQPATSFEHALELLNGVRQGLVASLFSASAERREWFLRDARAGVLKIGQATADVGVEAPFGGWKASGVGPPEHGDGDPEFYTRAQALYG